MYSQIVCVVSDGVGVGDESGVVDQGLTHLELKLFGLFNFHINPSGSYWDNQVFDL